MFNLLIDTLPTTVLIDDKEYKINSDFRTSILFEMLIEDDELTDEEKFFQAVYLYYDDIPENLEEAINKLLLFYKGGATEETDVSSSNKSSTISKEEKIYSYEYDSEYIYSAFLSQYKLDLNSIDYLHWWKFKALFKSLNEDNLISKIMGYRSIDLNEIEDDKEREHYKNLKELYKLPVKTNKVEDAKLKEMEDMLMNCKM